MGRKIGKLNENFVNELIKSCLNDKRILEIASEHIKYSFLRREEQKELWKAICNYFSLRGILPTIGILSQQFERDTKVLEAIEEVKQSTLPKKDAILEQLEVFAKDSLFVENYDKMAEAFNERNQEEAFRLVDSLGEKLSNFTIRDRYYDKIFEGFSERHRERIIQHDLEESSLAMKWKVPSGIDEIDKILRGGFDLTDTILFLAQSGVGKTKLLRWLGVAAARRGYKVLHIQAEGSKEECLRGYDSTFTGIKNQYIQTGDIEESALKKIFKSIRDVNYGGGEIYVESFEQFDSASMADVRDIYLKVQKAHGDIDLILIDYLELLDPGDGKKYSTSNEGERKRREAVANKMKNLAVEFNTRVASCTQASTVDPELLNDPNFVQTRYNISEFKGVIKPFSIFISLNQTKDEYANGIMRLYCDKMRNYRSQQIIKIYQNYEHDRFYDRNKTLSTISVT